MSFESIDPAWMRGLGGGLLIGLSAAFFMLFNGRIAGMTGILTSALTRFTTREGRESVIFLLGALIAPVLLLSAQVEVDITVTSSLAALVCGGLVVGAGVALANGCTSGHGVCGMSRLSWRSIAATVTFMSTTALSVFVVRHLLGVSL